MANKDINLIIGADSSGIESGLSRATVATREAAAKMTSEFKGVGESLNNLHSKISTAFEFIGAAAAVAGIMKIAQGLSDAADRAEQFKNSAQLVGATTTEFQGLAATAAQVGLPVETLQRGMMTLSQHMTMARDGSRQAQEQLAKVGITSADLSNPAFTAASALYAVAKSGAAAGDVQVLLGQRSAMLMTAFDKLRGGQKAMEEEAGRVNALNQTEIGTLDRYKEGVAVLGIEYENLKGHVAAYLIGASGPLVDSFRQLLGSFGDATGGIDVLKGAFATLESVIIVIVESIKGVVREFQALGTMAGDVMGSIGTLMHDALTGHWKDLKSDGASAFSMLKQDGIAAFDAVGGSIKDTISGVKKAWADAFTAPAEAAGPEARAQTGGGGTGGTVRSGNELAAMKKLIADKRALIRQELAEMTKEMNQEVEVAKTGYRAELEARTASLDREIAAVKNAAREGMIGPEQEFEQVLAILQQKLAAQPAYYEQLKALAGNNRVELAKIDAEEQKDQQTYLTEVAKLHEQTTLQIDRQWERISSKIGNSFSSMIDKMLQGTMNFHQMIQRTLDQMLMGFIKMETQSLTHHIATEIAKQQATAASALVQQTVTQQASRQGMMQSGMMALKKIANDAYEAAAGAYKATVSIPYIGPVLAPAAAAGAFAAVAVFSSGVASAAGGYDIPAGVNPLVQAHAREMVLPQSIAEPIRNMAAGGELGGGEVHHHTHNWSINAIDGHSFESLINDPSNRRMFERLVT